MHNFGELKLNKDTLAEELESTGVKLKKKKYPEKVSFGKIANLRRKKKERKTALVELY